MSQEENTGDPIRKRRTREHVLEDLSENYLEKKVLLNGHLLRRPVRDYGVDVTMFHFGSSGEIENGEIRFQLKATDHLNVLADKERISFPIKTADLHYWSMEIYPFILVVYDAKANNAFWLEIQDYVKMNPDRLDPDIETVNVHIPVSNELSVEAIEFFRTKSLKTIEELQKPRGFENG